MNTTVSAADVICVVDSPNVLLLYDIYHMQMMEGDFTRTLERYRQIIGYVHIADSPGRHEPGTGEINFQYFKKLLDTIEYTGIIGFELTPSGKVEECMRILHDF